MLIVMQVRQANDEIQIEIQINQVEIKIKTDKKLIYDFSSLFFLIEIVNEETYIFVHDEQIYFIFFICIIEVSFLTFIVFFLVT